MLSRDHFWWLDFCTAGQANRQPLHWMTMLSCTGPYVLGLMYWPSCAEAWHLRPIVWWRVVYILCLENAAGKHNGGCARSNSTGRRQWATQLALTPAKHNHCGCRRQESVSERVARSWQNSSASKSCTQMHHAFSHMHYMRRCLLACG